MILYRTWTNQDIYDKIQQYNMSQFFHSNQLLLIKQAPTHLKNLEKIGKSMISLSPEKSGNLTCNVMEKAN